MSLACVKNSDWRLPSVACVSTSEPVLQAQQQVKELTDQKTALTAQVTASEAGLLELQQQARKTEQELSDKVQSHRGCWW